MLLPKVNPDTGHSISHYLDRYNDYDCDADVVHKEIEEIAKENPTVAELIARWARLDSEDNYSRIAFCGILVYRMLRSQAEADQMEANFKYE